jgi:hypothetical protein
VRRQLRQADIKQRLRRLVMPIHQRPHVLRQILKERRHFVFLLAAKQQRVDLSRSVRNHLVVLHQQIPFLLLFSNPTRDKPQHVSNLSQLPRTRLWQNKQKQLQQIQRPQLHDSIGRVVRGIQDHVNVLQEDTLRQLWQFQLEDIRQYLNPRPVISTSLEIRVTIDSSTAGAESSAGSCIPAIHTTSPCPRVRL